MDSEKAELLQEDQEVPRSVEVEVDQFRLEHSRATNESDRDRRALMPSACDLYVHKPEAYATFTKRSATMVK